VQQNAFFQLDPDSDDCIEKNQSNGYAMTKAIHGNYKGFTKKQVYNEVTACDVHDHPSNTQMKHLMSTCTTFKTCPFNASDIVNANCSFCSDHGRLR
jgi:hypothetical protein